MRAIRSKDEVRELLEIEETDAWFEYLRETREAPAARCGRLHAIRTRRAELVPVA